MIFLFVSLLMIFSWKRLITFEYSHWIEFNLASDWPWLIKPARRCAMETETAPEIFNQSKEKKNDRARVMAITIDKTVSWKKKEAKRPRFVRRWNRQPGKRTAENEGEHQQKRKIKKVEENIIIVQKKRTSMAPSRSQAPKMAAPLVDSVEGTRLAQTP